MSGYLLAANNLSDVSNASSSRSNLGLGSSAILNTGVPNGVASLDTHGNASANSIIPQNSTTSISFSQLLGIRLDIRTFGAKMDLKMAWPNITMIAGSPTLTTSTSLFSLTDQTKAIQVNGAGISGGPLSATILTYVSATQVILDTNSATTLSSSTQPVFWGTDDSAAIAAAMNEAISLFASNVLSYVFIPPGKTYLKSTSLPTFYSAPIPVIGSGSRISQIVVDPIYNGTNGSLFSWSQCYNDGDLPSGAVTLSAPEERGPRCEGLCFVGNLLSSHNNAAINFLDGNDFVRLIDLDFYFWPGSVILTGNVSGYAYDYSSLRESRISEIRAFLCGSLTNPVIVLNSSVNSDPTNEIVLSSIDIYGPKSDGLVITNQNTATGVTRLIKIFGIRVEATTSGFSAIRIGDHSFAGGVQGIQIYGGEIVSNLVGSYGLTITAPSSETFISNIRFSGSVVNCSGTAIYINAGTNIDLDLVMNQTYSSGIHLDVTNNINGPVWINTVEDASTWITSIGSTAANNVFYRTWNNGLGRSISANYHDTATGGFYIGLGAVDLQLIRTSSSQVASGTGATLLGGSSSTAGGTYAVASGYQCEANGQYSLSIGYSVIVPSGASSSTGIGLNINFGTSAAQSAAFGSNHTLSSGNCLAVGASNTISGGSSSAIGSLITVSGSYSSAIGYSSIISGNSSIAVGNFVSVTGNNSAGFGYNARAYNNNRFTQSGGQFARTGDFQSSRILMGATTSSTSPTPLTCDGTGTISATNIALIESGCVFNVSIKLTAIDKTNAGNSYIWYLPFSLLTQFYAAGSTTFSPGTAQIMSTGTGSSSTVAVVTNTTYGGIYLNFTAPNSDAWHVVAEICFVEVG